MGYLRVAIQQRAPSENVCLRKHPSKGSCFCPRRHYPEQGNPLAMLNMHRQAAGECTSCSRSSSSRFSNANRGRVAARVFSRKVTPPDAPKGEIVAQGREWLETILSRFGPIKDRAQTVTTLDFEKPLLELDKRIKEVRKVAEDNGVDVSPQIAELESRARQLRRETYTRLTPVQRLQVARHPNRPTCLDIILNITDKFVELHGDRAGLDDPAIVCGIGNMDGIPFMFIGHQKGRNTKENIRRNFGMPQPNGYRKAMRFMRHADKFGLPIVTIVDTPGAFAGRAAEELGQVGAEGLVVPAAAAASVLHAAPPLPAAPTPHAWLLLPAPTPRCPVLTQGEAIAYNLREMFGLRVPIISLVIGEGGSGGALAIGCANKNLIMENAVYYVASPEACAAILWKSRAAANQATEALRITAPELVSFGVMDEIVPEALGGAHSDPLACFPIIKQSILDTYNRYAGLSAVEIQTDRYAKFRKLGKFQEWVVRGGDWRAANAEREAAVGVHTKAGTWAASEAEAHFIEQVRSKAISTRGVLISLGAAGGAWVSSGTKFDLRGSCDLHAWCDLPGAGIMEVASSIVEVRRRKQAAAASNGNGHSHSPAASAGAKAPSTAAVVHA
ncbi:hypothetical protein QJQ45_026786 [Haematococcus lacustris]|nr:hypothetical protein QJQ45_026786 [Haematococcus lacustris]